MNISMLNLKLQRQCLEMAVIAYACIMTLLAMTPRTCPSKQETAMTIRLLSETPRQLTEELIIPIVKGELHHVERIKRTLFEI